MLKMSHSQLKKQENVMTGMNGNRLSKVSTIRY